MPAVQQLLFPDPRPLVERLGPEFFRNIPETPGVYFMRDGADTILYIGKAKSLRRRLGSYRVANPDRMPRRTLRLLALVARIGWEQCPDEAAALRRESELLLEVRPRFNRAGVWRGPTRFLAWRFVDDQIEFTVTSHPEDGWQSAGPFGRSAIILRQVLVRLLWCAIHPRRGMSGLPAGWIDGRLDTVARLHCEPLACEIATHLGNLGSSGANPFCDWIRARTSENSHAFEKAAVETDLEFVMELFSK